MLSIGDMFLTAVVPTPSKATKAVLPPAPALTEAGSANGKRPAPFSIRLSVLERARLLAEANGVPLGSYIKHKILGAASPMSAPVKVRRQGIPVKDQQVLAQVVAILGRTRLSANLNQIAYAANCGVLPVSPETEAELRVALADIREMRFLLLTALGLQPERSGEAAP